MDNQKDNQKVENKIRELTRIEENQIKEIMKINKIIVIGKYNIKFIGKSWTCPFCIAEGLKPHTNYCWLHKYAYYKWYNGLISIVKGGKK